LDNSNESTQADKRTLTANDTSGDAPSIGAHGLLRDGFLSGVSLSKHSGEPVAMASLWLISDTLPFVLISGAQ
jgi:hypothetical protein